MRYNHITWDEAKHIVLSHQAIERQHLDDVGEVAFNEIYGFGEDDTASAPEPVGRKSKYKKRPYASVLLNLKPEPDDILVLDTAPKELIDKCVSYGVLARLQRESSKLAGLDKVAYVRPDTTNKKALQLQREVVYRLTHRTAWQLGQWIAYGLDLSLIGATIWDIARIDEFWELGNSFTDIHQQLIAGYHHALENPATNFVAKQIALSERDKQWPEILGELRDTLDQVGAGQSFSVHLWLAGHGINQEPGLVRRINSYLRRTRCWSIKENNRRKDGTRFFWIKSM